MRREETGSTKARLEPYRLVPFSVASSRCRKRRCRIPPRGSERGHRVRRRPRVPRRCDGIELFLLALYRPDPALLSRYRDSLAHVGYLEDG